MCIKHFIIKVWKLSYILATFIATINFFLKGHKVQIPERKILLIHQKSVVTCRERKAVPIHRCLTSEGTVIHQTTDRKINEKCDFFSTYSQMHKKFGLNSSSKMNK